MADSFQKRERDQKKNKKRRDKAVKRSRRRAQGPREVPVGSIEDVTGDLEAVERRVRMRRAAAEEAARTAPSRLFVGGLSWDTTEDGLRAAFAAIGPVLEAVVVTDRDSGRSRGFGFVTMKDAKDAARAMETLNGSELDGRRIVVNPATR